MEIQNISVYRKQEKEENGTFGQQNFLSIGKKGQILQGTLTSVTDRITIQINGVEIAVGKNAVKEPKEGQVRDFQITDVSKDSITLKDMSNVTDTSSVRAMKRTSVSNSTKSFADTLSDSQKTAQDKTQKSESLAILNGEDYREVEESEGSFEKTNQECIERAVERIKEQKEWKADRLQDYKEQRQEVEESRKKMQAEGFASQKTEAQVRNALEDAGIPTTENNMAKVMTAMGMSREALSIDDSTKAYIVGQDLSPTIENLYQGKYFGNNRSVSGETQEQEFTAYQDQIEKILADSGHTSQTDYENAKWLFANEFPIDQNSLDKLSILEDIQANMTPQNVLTQIIYAMLSGAQPKDAVMDDSQFTAAVSVVNAFNDVTDEALIKTADYVLNNAQTEWEQLQNGMVQQTGGSVEIEVNLELLLRMQPETADAAKEIVIPTVYANGMTQEEMMQVTLKRQLAEIQQKLTVSSVLTMEQKGISIDTASLENIIQNLREMEKAYYNSQVSSDQNVSDTDGSLELLQETLAKTDDIANAHAAVLGSSVRKQLLLTVNELHAATGSKVLQKTEWLGTYETVSTQVRPDFGDSIQKAFGNISSILQDLGLEDTKTNERAVRILGYNSMEITKENIDEVKILDQKVNHLLEQCRPTTVLSLIREGKNPLDMPIDELNRELERINEENGVTKEEKYSRFIWQLEKKGEITQEERSGYIGMYRLLNQLQSMDGAQIGAVLETGSDVTLGSLLTQGRIKKGNGIDQVIDEEHGFTDVNKTKESISDQIDKGVQAAYYQTMIQEMVQDISPDILQEMTDGEMEAFLGTSVEQMWEQTKQNTHGNDSKKEYFEEQAQEIREVFADSEQVQEYVSNLNVENTIENIIAAGNVLENGYSVYREADKRKNILDKEKQEEFDDTVDSFTEHMDSEEVLDAQCQKAEKIIEEVLAKSYEQSDITIEDLKQLKQLSRGMHFIGAIRQEKSYDIPIRTEDGITSLNLTIIRGAKESGKIQISMEDEVFGDVSIEFKVSQDTVQGLILCDQRQGFEMLKDQREALENNLIQAGYQVRDISYGMDFKSRNEMLKEKITQGQADIGSLYRVSKILVRSVVTAMKTK